MVQNITYVIGGIKAILLNIDGQEVLTYSKLPGQYTNLGMVCRSVFCCTSYGRSIVIPVHQCTKAILNNGILFYHGERTLTDTRAAMLLVEELQPGVIFRWLTLWTQFYSLAKTLCILPISHGYIWLYHIIMLYFQTNHRQYVNGAGETWSRASRINYCSPLYIQIPVALPYLYTINLRH